MAAKQATSLPLIYMLFLLLFVEIGRGNGHDECTPLRCSKHGPEIRFPFRLLQSHTKLCGYPDFEISCSANHHALLALSPTVKVKVDSIDYKSQLIKIHNTDLCFVKQLQLLNISASPFRFANFPSDYIFFNCSASDRDSELMYSVPCLSSSRHTVYAVDSNESLRFLSLSSCIRMYTIQSIPSSIMKNESYYSLSWSYPSCHKCEKEGKMCRAKDGVERETECYTPPFSGKGPEQLKSIIVTGVLVGVLVLVVAVLTLRHLRRSNIKEREIQRFLDDYKSLKPTRYSYSDIKRITNKFKDKLGQGGYGSVYKGNLSNEIFVAVKMLDKVKGNGEDFINEVATIGRIHHVNVVRLVGFCADGLKRALVYDYLPNGSLDRFTNPRTNDDSHNLGLEELHHIAVGIARGIEYLHQGCDQRILHFDIKPQNILLDQGFNPKVSDFGLAKLCSREKSAVSMTMARGTPGYIAPEVFSRNFGNVSLKSDIYSFGMLLLDMVGARKRDNVIIAGSASEMYFPDWIYDSLNRGGGEASWIQESSNVEIAKKLTITGLWCIQWYPVDRPSMKSVIQMLEGDVDGLRMPPKPFPTDDQVDTQITTHTGSWSSEVTVSYE